MNKYTAKQVAKTVCELGNWQVSNLKLQKILYIIHMFYMGHMYYKKEIRDYISYLVPGGFQAWRYGPVSPGLYQEFKQYKADSIPEEAFDGVDSINLENEDERLIISGINMLLELPAAKLVAITHKKDGGWDKTDSGQFIGYEDILYEYKNIHEWNYND